MALYSHWDGRDEECESQRDSPTCDLRKADRLAFRDHLPTALLGRSTNQESVNNRILLTFVIIASFVVKPPSETLKLIRILLVRNRRAD